METNLSLSTAEEPLLTPTALLPQYLGALRAGSGRQADQIVERALGAPLTGSQIYLDLFQPTGYEIGRLWQRNEFSVAQEHLATAIIERQMGDLHHLFKPAQTKAKTLVIGSVDQEFHRVGVRMVADFFEQDGWTVYYLGAAVPTATFVEMAREMKADLLGLSAQMVFHLPTIAEFDRELERRGLGGLPIMVGGLPFVKQPDLYQKFGVQFAASNAREAVAKANQFFAPLGLPMDNARSPLPRAEALAVFKKHHAQIVQTVVRRLLAAPGAYAHLGESAEKILAAGVEFATVDLETALQIGEPGLLDDQLAWAKDRLPHDGISSQQQLANLVVYAQVVDEILPAPAAQAVNRLVRGMIEKQRALI
jgi:MerR family transcriptional regulator, light-induced transcriptional regulator